MRRHRLLAPIGGALLLSGLALHAAGPMTWTSSTQADFLKGQTLGVSVDELGRLSAGPATQQLADAASPQVWSIAATPDGWVAGTGGDGRVLRSRNGQVTTLVDTAEENVYAVAAARDGRVFAATGPDGKVYAISPAGEVSVAYDPQEKYVWALAVDEANRLWIAAGTPAAVYRIDAGGAARLVYKPTADHVVSLTPGPDRTMLAGTAGPGRLYRFDANDRPSALLDSGMSELRGIAVAANGTIFAAALAGDGGNEGTSASASLGASASGGNSNSPASSTDGARKSVVYRLTPNAVPEPLWESPDLVYDLAADGDDVLAATGPNGHVFRVRPNGSEVLLGGVDATQITRFARSNDRWLLATANPGRVHSLGPGAASSGTYLSPARDAKVTAKWGSIRWEAAGAVAIATRTGNTSEPDDSWSAWSAAYADAGGSTITSPAGRYLQWRAQFTTASGATAGTLTSVSVGYLPANSRPVVTSITVHPAGAVFQRPFGEDGAIAGLDDAIAQQRRAQQGEPPAAAPALGRRMYQKGLQTLAWRAEDADGDRLTYDVAYRREGETAWHQWRERTVDPLIVWDTTTVPDGRYSIRITASDGASNTADRALAGARESAAFDVDNTGPVITIAPASANEPGVLTFTVRDAQSAIDLVEVAINGEYRAVTPADGVADSREERYRVTLPAGTNPSTVMIRATDVMQNRSTSAGR
jgi:hypothetical protein